MSTKSPEKTKIVTAAKGHEKTKAEKQGPKPAVPAKTVQKKKTPAKKAAAKPQKKSKKH